MKKNTAANLKKLSDTKKFVPVKNEHFRLIPPGTHIGYIYRDFSGDLVPIVSAFIKEHYTDSAGINGMLIKCGTNSYVNPYDSLMRIYIYAKDRAKVEAAIKKKLTQKDESQPDLEARIKKIETNIGNIVNCITRSVSFSNLAGAAQQPAATVKPPVKSRSLTHDKPPVAKTPRKKANIKF